jgi:N6-L-threonylcarbamoyladenine synthase
LLAKLDRAIEECKAPEVIVCGGVAANTLLRRRAEEVVAGRSRLTIPPLGLCTDNAAMIAVAAEHAPVSGPSEAAPSLSWET